MAIVAGLAWLYVRYGTTLTGHALIGTIEPAVLAIVVVALWELLRGAMKRRWFAFIAAGALAGYLAGADVLLILAGAGLVTALIEERVDASGASVFLPLAILARKPSSMAIAKEFAKLGVIVFGSGYALLAFLRRDLVTGLHWLDLRSVLDAVAAGQITPGPVFTTATFVGYLLDGMRGAMVATAAIFVPSFVMVAVLMPLVPRVRRSRRLGAALDGIVIGALGLMAGVTYDLGRAAFVDPIAIAVSAVSLAVLLRFRPPPLVVVAAAAAVGILRSLV
jgi:chromate transporter